jgi:hypothetical protein
MALDAQEKAKEMISMALHVRSTMLGRTNDPTLAIFH